jgi:hypothetical protein
MARGRGVAVSRNRARGEAVRPILVALLLPLGCHAPDRWSLEATRGMGTLEGGDYRNDGDRDFDSTALTVGISGPLLSGSPRIAQERVSSPEAPEVDLQPLIASLESLRASVEAAREKEEEKHPGAVETGATNAVGTTAALGLLLALLKGVPWGVAKWKARGEVEA